MEKVENTFPTPPLSLPPPILKRTKTEEAVVKSFEEEAKNDMRELNFKNKLLMKKNDGGIETNKEILPTKDKVSCCISTVEPFHKINSINQSLIDKELDKKLKNWKDKLEKNTEKIIQNIEINKEREQKINEISSKEKEILSNHFITEFLENTLYKNFSNFLKIYHIPSSSQLRKEFDALTKRQELARMVDELEVTNENCLKLCKMFDTFDKNIEKYEAAIKEWEQKGEDYKKIKEAAAAEKTARIERQLKLQEQTKHAKPRTNYSAFKKST